MAAAAIGSAMYTDVATVQGASSHPDTGNGENVSTVFHNSEEYYAKKIRPKDITDLAVNGDKEPATVKHTGGSAATVRESNEMGGEASYDQSLNQPRLDTRTQRILRAHLAEQILDDLSKLALHHGQPIAAVYANGFLSTARLFRDQSPFDPYLEILMSLYDALAFENRWLDYNRSQYEGAKAVLISFANQELDNKKIQKAVMKLEKLGFDTIPFGVELDFSEEESQPFSE